MKLHTIEVEVNGQVIVCDKKLALASDTVGKVDVIAMLDDRWDEYDNITIYFTNCKTKRRIAVSGLEMDIDYTIETEIPKEVLSDIGDISISIVGFIEEDGCAVSRLTTFTTAIATVTEKFNFIADKPTHKCLCHKDSHIYDYSLKKVGDILSLCYKENPISSVLLDGSGFEYMNKKGEWLYETGVEISDTLYTNAYTKMEEMFKGNTTTSTSNAGYCSAVYKDGLFGKNLDWTYDDTVQFVVKADNGTRKSVGVSGGIPALTRASMKSGAFIDDMLMIPFMVNDGVNESGLFVGLNVVPNNETKGGVKFTDPTTGTNPSSTEPSICALMLPRYILDNFDTAQEVVDNISRLNIYCPHSDSLNEEMHLIIGDSEKRFIIEFINNTVECIEITNTAEYMTNYYRYGAVYDTDTDKVDWTSLTDHSNGVMRGNLIAEALHNNSIKTNYDMLSFMNEELDYTNTYRKRSWIDEFCGVTDTFGNLTIRDRYEDPNKFIPIAAFEKGKYENRTRYPESLADTTWETVHSAVYDFDKSLLIIKVKDDDKVYTFGL